MRTRNLFPVAAVSAALFIASAHLTPAFASSPGDAWCETKVSIPRLGIKGLGVEYHSGVADNAAGERIQDRGLLAAPVDFRGHTAGPGGKGNFILSGHRTVHGAPLNGIRKLAPGDLIFVDEVCPDSRLGATYTVKQGARYVDYMTKGGKDKLMAAVPLRPGVAADDSYLTLVSCATPEDRKRGDHRRDSLGNPPGRWVVPAVLTASSEQPLP